MDERFVRMLRKESFDTVTLKGSQEATDRKISGMSRVKEDSWKGLKKKRPLRPLKPTLPNSALDPNYETVPVGLG